MIHFKLDENVPLDVGKILETEGFTVSSVFSEKISGIKDKDLMRLCIRKEFVLITLDKDFTRVTQPHEGIIVFRLRSQGAEALTAGLKCLMAKFDLWKSKRLLIIVEEERIRIRPSPLMKIV